MHYDECAIAMMTRMDCMNAWDEWDECVEREGAMERGLTVKVTRESYCFFSSNRSLCVGA